MFAATSDSALGIIVVAGVVFAVCCMTIFKRSRRQRAFVGRSVGLGLGLALIAWMVAQTVYGQLADDRSVNVLDALLQVVGS